MARHFAAADQADDRPRVHLDAPALGEVVGPLWAALEQQVGQALASSHAAAHPASHLRTKGGEGRYLFLPATRRSQGRAEGARAGEGSPSLPTPTPITTSTEITTNYSQVNLLQEGLPTTPGVQGRGAVSRPAHPGALRYPSTLYPVAEVEGMRLGGLPASCNLSHLLLQACREIGRPLSPDGDALAHQACLHRAWKVLLLGLGQAGAVARRVALVALGHAMQHIQATLLEGAVIGVCVCEDGSSWG